MPKYFHGGMLLLFHISQNSNVLCITAGEIRMMTKNYPVLLMMPMQLYLTIMMPMEQYTS